MVTPGPQFVRRASRSHDGEMEYQSIGVPGVAAVELSRTKDRHYKAPSDRVDETGQGVLVNSYPGKPWTVTNLAAHEEGRHHVPALLGLAAEFSLRTEGRFPAVSPDLSEHSERLVRKLADRGVVEMPHVSVNAITKSRDDVNDLLTAADMKPSTRHPENETAIPSRDVEHAARITRTLLRHPAARRESFDQGRLW